MANFCSKCGAPLTGNQKFCAECGSPVAGQVQAPPQPEPKQNTVPQPQQAYQQQQGQTYTYNTPKAPQNTVKQLVQKKNKKAVKKKSKAWLFILILLLLASLAFFGFRNGGWFRKKNVSYTPAAMDSLRAYAERLEEAGNTAAAEAVYEQIAKGGGAELIDGAHEEFPIIAASGEVDQLDEFANGVMGGVRG